MTDQTAKKPFDLIIFDCDGVLVDSEVMSTGTLLETLRSHGLDVDLAYVRKTYLGRAMPVVRADYLRLVGRDLPGTFEAEFLSRLFAAYREGLTAMPGVKAMLEALAIPFCMATSSSMERARLSLEVTGLLPFFEGRIFCASMVAQGKPAPDLFLHAAQTLGAEPKRCLVIEDSEVGIAAAKNAGMAAFRFIGGSHLKSCQDTVLDEEPGVPVFERIEDVAAALGVGVPSNRPATTV